MTPSVLLLSAFFGDVCQTFSFEKGPGGAHFGDSEIEVIGNTVWVDESFVLTGERIKKKRIEFDSESRKNFKIWWEFAHPGSIIIVRDASVTLRKNGRIKLVIKGHVREIGKRRQHKYKLIYNGFCL
jgi:hypothetical protein